MLNERSHAKIATPPNELSSTTGNPNPFGSTLVNRPSAGSYIRLRLKHRARYGPVPAPPPGLSTVDRSIAPSHGRSKRSSLRPWCPSRFPLAAAIDSLDKDEPSDKYSAARSSP